jgi:drug/metabolite transporter (DMT)-like permease
VGAAQAPGGDGLLRGVPHGTVPGSGGATRGRVDDEVPFRVYAGLAVTAILWGSAYAASKVLTFHVSPPAGAFLRFSVGSLLMAAWLARKGPGSLAVPRRAWPRLLLVSLLGVTGYNLFFFRGVAAAPSADAGVIVPTVSPLVAALGGMILLGERRSPRRFAGLALAVAGSLLFFRDVLAAGGGSARLHGDFLLLAGAVAWGVTTILSRPLMDAISPSAAAAWTLLLGSAGLLPFALPGLARAPWGALPPAFWLSLAWLVLFPTVVAYVFWMEGIRRAGAGAAAAFMFLSPLSALLLSAVWLGERPGPLQLGGAALLLVGVRLAGRPG